MNAIDAIRSALSFGDHEIRFIEDMRKSPVMQPSPNGGNHPLWILGHLTVVEGRLRQIVLGEPNPVERWKPLFDWGSEPIPNETAYPPFDEVLRAYRELRARNLRLLDEIGEAGLDRPTKAPPPGLETGFSNIGRAFLTIALHQTFHGGQASVARRASGRKPFFTPSEELRKS
jgi:uncharacterized damage-inducible protein DinB